MRSAWQMPDFLRERGRGSFIKEHSQACPKDPSSPPVLGMSESFCIKLAEALGAFYGGTEPFSYIIGNLVWRGHGIQSRPDILIPS